MGLTVACVYNDLEVRRHCLDRSLAAYAGPVPVQFLPVDNTAHAFASAGAALNHAARRAEHDVVVLVHQDVYLHDLDRLAAAAAALDDPQWGVLGASGVTSGRTWAGRLRDRVVLIGASAPAPVAVDTLDEVLFMARRADLLAEPLTEHPDLAWHAYAVEYALRVRAAGRRAGAVDTAITHNSLTVNLARLDEAHHTVGSLYPAQLPIRTTCGDVTGRSRDWRDLPVLRDHRWRRTWLRQSRVAARARAHLDAPVVLADIAHEVDLLEFSRDHPLHLVNLDSGGTFSLVAGDPVVLERRGRPVTMSAVADVAGLEHVLDDLAPEDHVLVTGLAVDELGSLPARMRSQEWLAGVQWNQAWLVGGPPAARPPSAWSLPRATPLGSAPLHRSAGRGTGQARRDVPAGSSTGGRREG